ALMTVLFIELGKDEKIIFMARQRLERRGQFVIGALFFGKPVFLPNPVWEVETRHADGRLDITSNGGTGHGFGRGARKDLAHGIEQRQTEGCAHAAEEGAARNHPVSYISHFSAAASEV